MNKTERMRAFSLRCDGKTWGAISQDLHYDPQTIRKDLQSVLEKSPHCPVIVYPALAQYICKNYAGSIEKFAAAMRVSPHRLRRVLVYGDKPAESLICKVTEATGLTREEAFTDGSHL